jgi:hypothetical protein
MGKRALSDEILQMIADYLAERRSPKDVSQWAAATLGALVLDSSEVLLDEALCTLASLGHDDPALDPSRGEIEHLRDALLGKTTHTVELRYTRAP